MRHFNILWTRCYRILRRNECSRFGLVFRRNLCARWNAKLECENKSANQQSAAVYQIKVCFPPHKPVVETLTRVISYLIRAVPSGEKCFTVRTTTTEKVSAPGRGKGRTFIARKFTHFQFLRLHMFLVLIPPEQRQLSQSERTEILISLKLCQQNFPLHLKKWPVIIKRKM